MSNLNIYSADKVVKDHLKRFWSARGVRVERASIDLNLAAKAAKEAAKAEKEAHDKLYRELKLLTKQHEAAIQAAIAEKAAQDKAATDAERIRVQSEQTKIKSSEARKACEALQAASRAYWAEKKAARKAREASRMDRLIAKAEAKTQAKEANQAFIAKRRSHKAQERAALLRAICAKLNEVPVQGTSESKTLLSLPMAFWVNTKASTTISSSNAAKEC